MCIRDSVTIAHLLNAANNRLVRQLERLVGLQGDCYAFAASVSYTHLRAHETVLDLVCRLLLEKKNKSRFQIDTITTTRTNTL